MTTPHTIPLPPPALVGAVSLETAIARRRTRRQFSPEPLSWQQIGQLLWAAGGITEAATGKRAAPSAGACYPLELYALLPDGLYCYAPRDHTLHLTTAGDLRRPVAAAAGQDFLLSAPLILVIAAEFRRTTQRYAQRGQERYVPMDVGHAAQNLLLQATALGLASCPVGAFDDEQMARQLRLPAGQVPLYLLPVGKAEAG